MVVAASKKKYMANAMYFFFRKISSRGILKNTIVGSYPVVGTPIIGGTMIPLANDGSMKTPYIVLYEEVK